MSWARGWVEYIGTGQNGNIESIFVHKSQLFDSEQKDKTQALMRSMVEVIV